MRSVERERACEVFRRELSMVGRKRRGHVLTKTRELAQTGVIGHSRQ